MPTPYPLTPTIRPWSSVYITVETAGFARIHQSYFRTISSTCCIGISSVASVSMFLQFLIVFIPDLVFYILNHVLGTDDVKHNLSLLYMGISKLSGSPGHARYGQFIIYPSHDVSLHLFQMKDITVYLI
jgi:hypothetical protein